ncbi:Protein of unknown function [Pyronema omphalodes CBS 100304]|uniref:Uncharacterized protein n=1 Tax=Pyronema omphalodes (strain CBS 100304) TaxID=1076935 RepID=U4L070_PYROM|nr:Protein of unknown function [Pyronema omphalodes CBS 100304]
MLINGIKCRRTCASSRS